VDAREEGFAARDDATVARRGPKRRLSSVHEESGWRRAVSDDAVRTNAEDAMGHFVIRRNPAERVSLPAEFRERSVEQGGEGREHDLDVEASDSMLRRCAWHLCIPLLLA
jgi:hypothetical protein